MYEIIFILDFVPFKFIKTTLKKISKIAAVVWIYIYIIQKQKKVAAEGND